MRSLQRISATIDRLNDRIGAAIQWIALVMVIVGAFNAIARYAGRYTGLSLSSNWYLELQWYLFSLIFLMGAAYGLNHDYHVRVDVLYARLGRRARAWIDLIGSALFLVPFAFVMLWISWGPVVNSWSILETSPDPGGLPRYPIKTVMLVSFFLLLLQAISQIVKNVAILGESAEGPPEGPPEGSAGSDDPKGSARSDDPEGSARSDDPEGSARSDDPKGSARSDDPEALGEGD